jgi:drug/metabolite transporter superfamily protein YnfA
MPHPPFFNLAQHAGAIILVLYGSIPTYQPEGAGFARVYAVYVSEFVPSVYALCMHIHSHHGCMHFLGYYRRALLNKYYKFE